MEAAKVKVTLDPKVGVVKARALEQSGAARATRVRASAAAVGRAAEVRKMAGVKVATSKMRGVFRMF